MAHEHHPDLVLLDVMMPGIDGYETCRQFRLDPVLRMAKIILVSAKAMVEERLRGYEAGADDYITKPYEPAELEAKVKVFLRLKHVEELDKMKSDLMVLITHETRTPLASMFGALELIHREADESANNLRELCNLAVGSMGRLRELLEKSQLLCEFRSENVEISPHSFAVADVLTQIVGRTRDRANRGDLEIRIEAPPDLRVHADPEYLPMVLEYMLDYAVRLSPVGEPVDLIAGESGGDTVFQVVYRGPGIPADRLATLFEPLNAVDVDHHSRGTGLGLALAREVARRHGGDVAAISVPDKETRFSLRVPALISKPGAGGEPEADRRAA
jgi:signal transduction histidine kinase